MRLTLYPVLDSMLILGLTRIQRILMELLNQLLMLERVAEGALRSGSLIRGFQLKVPLVEHKMSLWIKEHLETSSTLKKLLLMLVLFGTSMVIADGVVCCHTSNIRFPTQADGVVTPAMSGKSAVMSAVDGLKAGISSVNEGSEVMFADLLLC
ncbi:probable potassium transporter 14 isoform X2 [Triticum aestivum]|uniref:probable potassium transporter 14 isoform X2 n=1 Tax=Triticum aestivum TaxID=4565 RepID=UPI001D01543D|nr:probable potassium transporter 14 isoform X2 [Triticum aestivum]